jgi:hypothetical protein
MKVARTLGVGLLLFFSFLSLAAGLWRHHATGLRLTIQLPSPSATDPQVLERRAAEVSSDVLLLDPQIPTGLLSARWEGYWQVDRDGPYDLMLKGREPGEVWLDGSSVLVRTAEPYPREKRVIWLTKGLHSLGAEFQPRSRLPVFKLTVTPARGDVGPRDFFPDRPSSATLRVLAAASLLHRLTLGVWLLALAWGGVVLFKRFRWRSEGPPLGPRLGRGAILLPAVLIVLYGGALRLEAVVREYWGMDAPAWARQLTSAVSYVRPQTLKLPPMEPVDAPYGGDPAGYLRYARDMERFYDAHLREPLFVFATKIGLAFSGGADVAVSLTAAVFSTLMVWATYLVGCFCFNRRVGLLAAFLLAVERSVIASGADGWRDDAFAFFVLLSALALARLGADPSFKNAVWVGLAGGAACLTRITSLSFFLPALLFSCFWGGPPSRRRRLEAAGLSLLICAVLVTPYLASCAIALGDPFISINAHTQFYRARAGLPEDPPMSWLQYLSGSFQVTELVRNLLVGLTTFPFNNKWLAFNLWLPRSSGVLRVLSVAGMLLFLRCREGRLLLLLLFTALVPFAFTWGLVGGDDLRFTLHAYPLYLLAAAYSFDCTLGLLSRLLPQGDKASS